MRRFMILLVPLILLLVVGCGSAPPAAQQPAASTPMATTAPADDTTIDTPADNADTPEEPVADDMETTDVITADDDMETTDVITTDDDMETTDVITDDETMGDSPAAAAGDGATVTYVIDPARSQVAYAVDEVFIRDNNTLVTAVGVTEKIEGEVYYDPENPQNSSISPITIDISLFTSDSERRDNAIREKWLESTTYPLATFTPTNIEGLPTSYTDGEDVTLQITGDLTVREITVPVTFETRGWIEGDEMTGTAKAMVQMTDFGFDPPDIAGILKAENDVAITFDFVAVAQ